MFANGINPNLMTTGWNTPMMTGPMITPGFSYGFGPSAPAAPAPGFGAGYAFAGYGMDGATVPAAATAIPQERFATSMSGGVMLDKDGKPAGRVPENSFVDLKDGSVYGPDGKPLQLPEGGSVDFFDLPDIAMLQSDFAATSGGGGSAKGAVGTNSFVNGQWGPGGITDLKGGSKAGHADCDSLPAPGSKVGSSSGPGSKVGSSYGPGSKGGGFGMNGVAALQQQVSDALAQLGTLGVGMPGMMPSNVGGAYGAGPIGPMNALGGHGMIGMMPGRLEHSLSELVFVLRDLVSAMQQTTGGGAPAKPSTDTTQADSTQTQAAKPTTETPETSTSTSTSDSSTSTSMSTGSGTTSTSTSTSTSTDDSTSTSTSTSA
jgi:hypothetical protein